MIGGRSVLTIVTARGGSKALPGKNVKDLRGRPLLSYTLEAAQASQYVDRVVVSTDSEQIASVARAHGGEVPFLRPPDLATDLARQEDAVLHAMRWVEDDAGSYDYVVLLAPTHPLRSGADVDAVLEHLVRNDAARAVVTVVPADHPPYIVNTLPADGSMKGFVSDEHKFKNRQEFPPFYKISGSVCAAEWAHFRAEQSFLTDDTHAVVVDPVRGHDINTATDFAMAEFFLLTGLLERTSGPAPVGPGGGSPP